MMMQRSGTFTKSVPADDGPYFSLNKNLTDDKDLGPEPEGAVLEQMKQVDPQLSSTWTIWEQHKQTSKDGANYSSSMKEVVNFSTVKEFWGCWGHLPQPSELLEGKKFVREGSGGRKVIDSIAIFRKGVQPEWEDPQNANGGHLQLTLKPKLGGGIIDELWNNVILGMISDAIEPSSMLTGARLVDKLDMKGGKAGILRIELWFNELDEESKVGGQGKVYDLRGSFERCIRVGLNGKDKPVSWNNTEMKPHASK